MKKEQLNEIEILERKGAMVALESILLKFGILKVEEIKESPQRTKVREEVAQVAPEFLNGDQALRGLRNFHEIEKTKPMAKRQIMEELGIVSQGQLINWNRMKQWLINVLSQIKIK